MSSQSIFTSSLWQACEQYYPAVEVTALQLQDRHGVIINLLLLALELDNQQLRLAPQRWQQLHDVVSQWQQRILVPYRQLRRLSKTHVDQDVYQQMLQLELLLEHKCQQFILQQLWNETPEPQTTGQSNLRDYLTLLQLDLRDYPMLAQQDYLYGKLAVSL